MLELLVVLVILAITTALAPLAWRTPRVADDGAVNGLTQSARREAIRRGEELRLQVDADGAWVLAARDGAEVLETGRIPAPAEPVSLRVDALGTCRPGRELAGSAASFDMLSCRFVATTAATAAASGVTR